MCEYSLLKTRIEIDQDKCDFNQDEIKYQKLNIHQNVGHLGGGGTIIDCYQKVSAWIIVKNANKDLSCQRLTANQDIPNGMI